MENKEMEMLTDDELLGVAGGLLDNVTIAYQVLDGKWGNGQDRINRLAAAGYDYNAVQSTVNYILKNPQRYAPNYNLGYTRDPYLS